VEGERIETFTNSLERTRTTGTKCWKTRKGIKSIKKFTYRK